MHQSPIGTKSPIAALTAASAARNYATKGENHDKTPGRQGCDRQRRRQFGPGWGNGKCTAITFAREGAKVVVADINRAAAEETATLITDEGGTALVIEADTTSESDMNGLVARTLSEYGKLDILAQIVGISGRHTFFDDTEEEWDRVMTVNVKAAMLASRAALRPMIEQRWAGSSPSRRSPACARSGLTCRCPMACRRPRSRC